ncbi:acyl-CoA thioesterase [Cryptosporangium arvum]|uniref:acyl-CoA thioesterase n=1 Tax=Cryptosporangium arvum TaxID=80871 RepID=UPI0004B9FDE4|nr:acyl-CoA thioesterase [Cryptosporangium arvum]
MTHTTRITVRSDDIDANGHVRDSKYLDYAVHARWVTLAHAGLDAGKLVAAGLGPVNLEVSITYAREVVLGDEIAVETRFEYPSPKLVKVVQTLTRRDGIVAAQVVSVTGLMDLRRRKLVDDAAGRYGEFLSDLTVVDLVPFTGSAPRTDR